MSKLIKGQRSWQLSGLRGLDYNQFSSVLNQTLELPGCPNQITISDIGETYSVADLQNKAARQLLWQKL